jgi:flagellar biosynthetic protein FliR
MPVALLIAWVLITVRAAAFLLLLPGLTGTPIPITMRLGLSLGMATLIAPLIPLLPHPPATLLALGGAVGAEVGYGLLLGFVGRMAFYATEMAGRIIATEIGLTATPGVDAPTASNEPFAAFLHRFAVLLYFVVGAHLLALGAFARSFRFAPPGLAGFSGATGDQLIGVTGQALTSAVQISAPFIAMNFLLTLAFGLLGRTVPKINVFILSLGARSLGGLIMVGAAAALFGRFLLTQFHDLPGEMLRMLPVR